VLAVIVYSFPLCRVGEVTGVPSLDTFAAHGKTAGAFTLNTGIVRTNTESTAKIGITIDFFDFFLLS
jgi:hypothetical protein